MALTSRLWRKSSRWACRISRAWRELDTSSSSSWSRAISDRGVPWISVVRRSSRSWAAWFIRETRPSSSTTTMPSAIVSSTAVSLLRSPDRSRTVPRTASDIRTNADASSSVDPAASDRISSLSRSPAASLSALFAKEEMDVDVLRTSRAARPMDMTAAARPIATTPAWNRPGDRPCMTADRRTTSPAKTRMRAPYARATRQNSDFGFFTRRTGSRLP